MPRELIKTRHDTLFKSRITSLITSLSKKYTVFAVVETSTRCDNCVYDEVHKTSSGKYNGTGPMVFSTKVCPRCKGKGVLVTSKKTKLTATVDWSEMTLADADKPTPQGQVPFGHAMVNVLAPQVPFAEAATYFTLNGTRCTRVGRINITGLLSEAVGHALVKIDK